MFQKLEYYWKKFTPSNKRDNTLQESDDHDVTFSWIQKHKTITKHAPARRHLTYMQQHLEARGKGKKEKEMFDFL